MIECATSDVPALAPTDSVYSFVVAPSSSTGGLDLSRVLPPTARLSMSLSALPAMSSLCLRAPSLRYRRMCTMSILPTGRQVLSWGSWLVMAIDRRRFLPCPKGPSESLTWPVCAHWVVSPCTAFLQALLPMQVCRNSQHGLSPRPAALRGAVV